MYEDFNIQSLTWIDAEQTAIEAVVNGKRSTVPADPANRHYKYILDNALVIDPYVAPPVVVDEVTKTQFVKHLKATGNVGTVRTYVSGLAQDDDIRIEWDTSSTVRKDSLLVAGIKAQLSLTDPQVDAFFVAASQI